MDNYIQMIVYKKGYELFFILYIKPPQIYKTVPELAFKIIIINAIISLTTKVASYKSKGKKEDY